MTESASGVRLLIDNMLFEIINYGCCETGEGFNSIYLTY